MAGVAHDPKFARKVGIAQSVGRDFNQADKRAGPRSQLRHYSAGKRRKSR